MMVYQKWLISGVNDGPHACKKGAQGLHNLKRAVSLAAWYAMKFCRCSIRALEATWCTASGLEFRDWASVFAQLLCSCKRHDGKIAPREACSKRSNYYCRTESILMGLSTVNNRPSILEGIVDVDGGGTIVGGGTSIYLALKVLMIDVWFPTAIHLWFKGFFWPWLMLKSPISWLVTHGTLSAAATDSGRRGTVASSCWAAVHGSRNQQRILGDA